MQFILTCPNGKQIDMSNYIMKQIMGEMTHKQVQNKIKEYNIKNK